MLTVCMYSFIDNIILGFMHIYFGNVEKNNRNKTGFAVSLRRCGLVLLNAGPVAHVWEDGTMGARASELYP